MRRPPSGDLLPVVQATVGAGTINAHANVVITVTVPGAVPGDGVVVTGNAPGVFSASLSTAAFVTAENEVKIVVTNVSGNNVNLAVPQIYSVALLPSRA